MKCEAHRLVYVEPLGRGGISTWLVFAYVGNNTERGGESVLSSQIFPFSNPNNIRYFS